VAGVVTALIFFTFGEALLSDLENHGLTVVLFFGLFGVMMWGSLIVLNGMVGTALLIGALRYWEQECNLTGARSFLVVMSALSIVALVLPKYTETAPSPVEAPGKALLFIAITILFYGVFIFIQTMRHGAFFAEPETRTDVPAKEPRGHAANTGAETGAETTHSLAYHVVMLLLTLIPVVALSEYLAVIVDFGIEDLGLPEPLGGLLIAILVLAPEGLTAFHAALANHLQRAVNVCLGSAC